MKRQKISVFAAAAIVSLIASVACLEWLRSVPPKKPVRYTTIVLAAVDLRQGEKIQPEHLKYRKIIQDASMEDWFMYGAEINAYLGYQIKVDIKAGTPIFRQFIRLE